MATTNANWDDTAQVAIVDQSIDQAVYPVQPDADAVITQDDYNTEKANLVAGSAQNTVQYDVSSDQQMYSGQDNNAGVHGDAQPVYENQGEATYDPAAYPADNDHGYADQQQAYHQDGSYNTAGEQNHAEQQGYVAYEANGTQYNHEGYYATEQQACYAEGTQQDTDGEVQPYSDPACDGTSVVDTAAQSTWTADSYATEQQATYGDGTQQHTTGGNHVYGETAYVGDATEGGEQQATWVAQDGAAYHAQDQATYPADGCYQDGTGNMQTAYGTADGTYDYQQGYQQDYQQGYQQDGSVAYINGNAVAQQDGSYSSGVDQHAGTTEIQPDTAAAYDNTTGQYTQDYHTNWDAQQATGYYAPDAQAAQADATYANDVQQYTADADATTAEASAAHGGRMPCIWAAEATFTGMLLNMITPMACVPMPMEQPDALAAITAANQKYDIWDVANGISNDPEKADAEFTGIVQTAIRADAGETETFKTIKAQLSRLFTSLPSENISWEAFHKEIEKFAKSNTIISTNTNNNSNQAMAKVLLAAVKQEHDVHVLMEMLDGGYLRVRGGDNTADMMEKLLAASQSGINMWKQVEGLPFVGDKIGDKISNLKGKTNNKVVMGLGMMWDLLTSVVPNLVETFIADKREQIEKDQSLATILSELHPADVTDLRLPEGVWATCMQAAGGQHPLVALGLSSGSVMVYSGAECAAGKLTQVAMLVGHSVAVTQICPMLDGKLLVTTSTDNTAIIWQQQAAYSYTPTRIRFDEPVVQAAAAAGSSMLALAHHTSVTVWDMNKYCQVAKIVLPYEGSGWIKAVAINKEGTLVYLAIGTQIQVWTVAEAPEQLIIIEGHEGDVTALALSASGKTLASGSGKKSVKVWDVSNARQKHAVLMETLPGHDKGIWNIEFADDDGHEVVTVCASFKKLKRHVSRSQDEMAGFSGSLRQLRKGGSWRQVDAKKFKPRERAAVAMVRSPVGAYTYLLLTGGRHVYKELLT